MLSFNQNNMQFIVKDTVEIRFQKSNDIGSQSSLSITTVSPESLDLSTSEEKIIFILKFEGKKGVSIYNPLYYLKVEFLDKDKKPLPVKQKPSVLLLNLNRPVDPEEDFIFKVKEVRQNGTSIEVPVSVNEPIVNFESNSSYSYTLELDFMSGELKDLPFKERASYLFISGNLVDYKQKDKTKSSNPFNTNPIPLKH